MKRIIGGDFPAEIYWEEKASVKLPTINLVNEPSYNLFRDEILAPLCQSGDIFISNHSYNNTLLQYMKEIGIDIIPYKIKNKREHSTIFASLLQDKEKIERINMDKDTYTVYPYAIVPGVDKIDDLLGKGKWNLPQLSNVQKVNSKIYSTRLSKEVCNNNYSEICNSITDLQHALEKYKEGAIVKEEFGVSGKGSLFIKNPRIGMKMIRYLENQSEKTNGKIRFIVEPFFDVKEDFSCLFEIEKDGKVEKYFVTSMINKHLKYYGTREANREFVKKLEVNNYFKVIELVAKSVYKSGYWGPVCVDSMMLKDGTIIPITEINARLSMGRIKIDIERKLKLPRTLLTHKVIKKGEMNTYEDFLSVLDKKKLLYHSRTGKGIIPLTGSLLFTEKATEGCDFFYMIVFDELNELNKFNDDFDNIFELNNC